MNPAKGEKGNVNLLCSKGLARRHGLIDFLIPRAENDTEDMTGGPRADLLLRHDDGVLREVFNARYGESTLMNPALMHAEFAKRESLLRNLYRLYRIGRDQTPAELRRELQASDVEAVISSIQRLSFSGSCGPEELVEFCEASGNRDDDVLAHVMDPLQLRYLLTFHRAGTRDEICSAGVDTLIAACQRRDTAGIRSWFQSLTSTKDSLPGDAPQYFRSVLFHLWKAGGAELGVLAHEIAVLDVQLFEDVGWESTRAFCAQLRRVTGPGCEALDGFLTDEDIDSALVIAEELEQDDLVAHFRKLAKTYNTKLLRDLRRSVMSAATRASESDVAQAESRASTPTNDGVEESAFRSLRLSAVG